MECKFKIGDRVRVRDGVSDYDLKENYLKRDTTYEIVQVTYSRIDWVLKVKDWDDCTADAFASRFEKVEDQKEEFKMTADPNYKIREGDKLLIEVEAVKCVPNGDSSNENGWVSAGSSEGEIIAISVNAFKSENGRGPLKLDQLWIKRDQIIEVKQREFKEGDRVSSVGTFSPKNGVVMGVHKAYIWVLWDEEDCPSTYYAEQLVHESK